MTGIGTAARLVGALMLGSALAACTAQPSANDIKQAILDDASIMGGLNMSLNANARLLGTRATDSAEELVGSGRVEKGECAEAGAEPGFVCDYRLTIFINGREEIGLWNKSRFFQAGGQWQLEQAR